MPLRAPVNTKPLPIRPPGSTSGAPAFVTVLPPTFDSGIVTLPNALTVLTAAEIRAGVLVLTNLTVSAHLVTVTNTAGAFKLKDYPLQGRMTVSLDFGRGKMLGVKWNTDAAASVNAQLVGDLV